MAYEYMGEITKCVCVRALVAHRRSTVLGLMCLNQLNSPHENVHCMAIPLAHDTTHTHKVSLLQPAMYIL